MQEVEHNALKGRRVTDHKFEAGRATPSSPELVARLRQDFCTEPECPSPLTTQVNGSHYKNLAIQPVEFITANGLAFLEGCVIKRMCRHSSKDGVDDLRKAVHEIRLLAHLTYGVEL